MPLPICTTINPVLPIWPNNRLIHSVQKRWCRLWFKKNSLSAQSYLAGFRLRYDGHYWWIGEDAYELVYFAHRCWWYLTLKHCLNGQKESFRILNSQLSSKDRWQLQLLFQLWR